MKIMLVMHSIGVGGAERVVTTLANEFAARGHVVCLVTLEVRRPALPLSESVQLLELNARKSLGGFLHVITSLRRAILDFKPDVVHSHMVHSNLIARLLRCVTSMPRLISTVHSTNEGGWPRMMGYRLTHRCADLTTNVSVEAVEAYEKKRAVPKGQMLAVHNGIDTCEFHFSQASRDRTRDVLGVGLSTRLILAVGRLEREKNYPNLLNALARLPAFPSWRAVIAGEGALESDLRRMVTELGLVDQVTFLGVRRDVRQLMCAADVFVLPSDYEGFGMVVAEAMACERVVVATDCGGIAEVMGGLGYLVPPKNSDALAAALAQAMLIRPDLAQRVGRLSRERVKSLFSLEAAVDRWLSLYECNLVDAMRDRNANKCVE